MNTPETSELQSVRVGSLASEMLLLIKKLSASMNCLSRVTSAESLFN